MMNQKKIYTGIGSRKTPKNMLDLITCIASQLNSEGWLLRSGGAAGADLAFEENSGPESEIFIPANWNKKRPFHINEYSDELWNKATEIAKRHIAHWSNLSKYGKLLHTRNVFQVLGKDLNSPSKMVICWTPDGISNGDSATRATGGTGTAIKIANTYSIPVFNIQNPQCRARIERWVENSKAITHNPEP